MNPISPFSSAMQQATIKMMDEKPSKVLFAYYDIFSKYKSQITDSERTQLANAIEHIAMEDPKLEGIANKMLNEIGKVKEIAQKVIKLLEPSQILKKYGNDFEKIANQGTRQEIFCLLYQQKDLPSSFIIDLLDQVKEGDEELANALVSFNPPLTLSFCENWLEERPSFKNSAPVMKRFVENNWELCKHISPSLKNNKDFFLDLIPSKGVSLLRFAGDKITKSEDFFLELAKKRASFDTWGLNYASSSLKENRDFIFKMMEIDPRSFFHASDKIKDDKKLVLYGIEKDPYVLMEAGDKLKEDPEVVFLAISKDPETFHYASEKLKNNEAFVLKAVNKAPRALEFVSDELKGKEDIVLAAVEKDGLALEYATEQMKANPKVYLTAFKNNGCALQFLDPQLRNKREIALEAIKNDGNALKFTNDTLKKDRDLVSAALISQPSALMYVDETLVQDPIIQAIYQVSNYFELSDRNNSDWLNIKDNERLKKSIKKIPDPIFFELLKKIPDIKERLYLAAQREAFSFIPPNQANPTIIELTYQNQRFSILESVLESMSPPLYDELKLMQEAAQNMKEPNNDKSDAPLRFKLPENFNSLHSGILKVLSRPEKMETIFSLKADVTLYQSAYEMLSPFVDKLLTDEEKNLLRNIGKKLTKEQESSFAAKNIDLLIGKKPKN